jgi:hypothetical protein
MGYFGLGVLVPPVAGLAVGYFGLERMSWMFIRPLSQVGRKNRGEDTQTLSEEACDEDGKANQVSEVYSSV